ncbi:MAG TPA: hypothetical protein VFC78_07200 [Tepidisphaeraceae bacterium]|nr:hypothetical protein [Tepidisphaeraceae bacterium]
MSIAFKSYSRPLRKLHSIIRDGCGESAEADEIREGMDGPRAAMSQAERELTRVLSTDLYDLNADYGPPEMPQTPEDM